MPPLLVAGHLQRLPAPTHTSAGVRNYVDVEAEKTAVPMIFSADASYNKGGPLFLEVS